MDKIYYFDTIEECKKQIMDKSLLLDITHSTNANLLECGIRTPKEIKKDRLVCGEVGWIAASIKNIQDVRVGDTITLKEMPAIEPLAGYRELNPMV